MAQLASKTLESLGYITLDSIQEIKSQDIFFPRKDPLIRLTRTQSFKDHFLPLVSEVISCAGGELEKLYLPPSSDLFLVREYQGIHIQPVDVIAGQIATLVLKQSQGQAGELIHPSKRRNIFYFERTPETQGGETIWYVMVMWHEGLKVWYFDCCDASGIKGMEAVIYSPKKCG